MDRPGKLRQLEHAGWTQNLLRAGSVQPGETIRFMVSCEAADTFRADIVRLIHGDENPQGPGFKEDVLDTSVNGEYPGRYQAIHAGSHVLVQDGDRLNSGDGFTLHAFIMPTTPGKGAQGLLTKWSEERKAGHGLFINEQGRLCVRLGDGSGQVTEVSVDKPLIGGVWYSPPRRKKSKGASKAHST